MQPFPLLLDPASIPLLRTLNGSSLAVSGTHQALEKDKAALMETDSPALRKIRTLENRLDKAMVKHNEAASIDKTYESIVQRLKDERVTFDAQLRAVEDAVKSKTLDLDQLHTMAVEARAAKEEAMGELHAVEAAVERERAHRARELEERRAQVRGDEEAPRTPCAPQSHPPAPCGLMSAAARGCLCRSRRPRPNEPRATPRSSRGAGPRRPPTTTPSGGCRRPRASSACRSLWTASRARKPLSKTSKSVSVF